ncbi:MAG: hypothetical protein IJW24_01330 [Clostridia bacterium]|nr:hypothetical protein [Clostridia bacterium]
MKKQKRGIIIASCVMALLMCLSIILPSISNSQHQLATRNINTEELGTLSYEEKVDKLSEQFSNVQTENDGDNYYFSGEINYSELDLLSTEYEDSEVTKNIGAKLSSSDETIEISNDVVIDGEHVFNESFKFSTEYDEETEELFIVDENGDKVNILDELNEENVEECFFLTAAISFFAALTVKQVVAIVVVAVVATTVIVVAENSDVISRDLDRLLSGVKDGVKSFWERIKLACGKITAIALSAAVSLTAELATEVYKKAKNRKDCYLLCGTITGNGFIPVKYKFTSYENARNWIKKGGSVWSPFSSTAEKCVTGAGFVPGIIKRGVPEVYVTERHNISFMINGQQIDYGFYHYHALTKGSLKKYGAVHSFFGQPFSGAPVA